MEKKRLIILGGSMFELPLLLKAKEMGYFIYLVDIDSKAVGHSVSDFSINLSTRDIESIKRFIDTLSPSELSEIQGIGSVDSDVHATIAALSSHLNLKHFNYTISELITNKYKLYNLMKGYNEKGFFPGLSIIPSEIFWFYNLNLENKSSNQIVLKPTENMGGLGVIKAKNNDVYDSFMYSKKHSPTGEVLVQPFIEGDTYKVQFLIGEKNIAILNLWKITNMDSNFLIERKREDKVSRKIAQLLIDYSLDIIQRLKIHHMPCEIKYIVSEGKLYFLDINLRLEGGFFIDDRYHNYLDYDILTNYISTIIGKEPEVRSLEKLASFQKDRSCLSLYKIYFRETPILTENNFYSFSIKRELPDVLSSKYYDKIYYSFSNKKQKLKIIYKAKEESYEKEILVKAVKNFAGRCKVCKICDGLGCIGELPGMGGAYRNEAFISNYYDLRATPLKVELLNNKTFNFKNNLFGKNLQIPIGIAPISGVVSNLGGVLDEEEYYNSILQGAIESRILGFIGDGSSDDKYLQMSKILEKVNYDGIITLKPRYPLDKMIKKLKYFEQTPINAIAIDIDSVILPTMKKSDVKIERYSIEDIAILREATNKKLIIKGISNTYDCLKLAKYGINSIIISNHGGRTLSSMQSTIKILQSIDIEFIKREFPNFLIGFDGGVRNGEDIVKVLLYNIDFVLIGRPFAIYAAGGGKEGIKLLVNKYLTEFNDTLKLIPFIQK
ncbi:MAG: ATP-grasp domain-containing protein [Spirochaetales bacterium]|nr:ATP-grasp domain-containing protein [Spirochaetales bacterium]